MLALAVTLKFLQFTIVSPVDSILMSSERSVILVFPELCWTRILPPSSRKTLWPPADWTRMLVVEPSENLSMLPARDLYQRSSFLPLLLLSIVFCVLFHSEPTT